MDILNILKEACNQVYDQARTMIGTERGNEKVGRGAGGDISRRIDIVAEEAVMEIIKKHDFHPTVIAEESGRIEGKDQGFLVIDAIDGTTNTSRAIPFCCCSLAYALDFKLSSVIHGAVLDLSRGDLYYASNQQGAFMNNTRNHVSKSLEHWNIDEGNNLDDILVGVNISGASPQVIMSLFKVISKANHVRHFGANALELCYFARGLLDAYIDIRGKIRATDLAAAYLVVNEAGGKLYSMDGSKLDSELGNNTKISFVAATNDDIFAHLAADMQIRG
ncbi:MAG TPA: inositol monophosphatase family protein [Candidatus Bathyarchaeia archaeon]|nr:inositol monophosphatase family protein [Candidatus Bathyarchaeia archaeon]